MALLAGQQAFNPVKIEALIQQAESIKPEDNLVAHMQALVQQLVSAPIEIEEKSLNAIVADFFKDSAGQSDKLMKAIETTASLATNRVGTKQVGPADISISGAKLLASGYNQILNTSENKWANRITNYGLPAAQFTLSILSYFMAPVAAVGPIAYAVIAKIVTDSVAIRQKENELKTLNDNFEKNINALNKVLLLNVETIFDEESAIFKGLTDAEREKLIVERDGILKLLSTDSGYDPKLQIRITNLVNTYRKYTNDPAAEEISKRVENAIKLQRKFNEAVQKKKDELVIAKRKFYAVLALTAAAVIGGIVTSVLFHAAAAAAVAFLLVPPMTIISGAIAIAVAMDAVLTHAHKLDGVMRNLYRFGSHYVKEKILGSLKSLKWEPKLPDNPSIGDRLVYAGKWILRGLQWIIIDGIIETLLCKALPLAIYGVLRLPTMVLSNLSQAYTDPVRYVMTLHKNYGWLVSFPVTVITGVLSVVKFAVQKFIIAPPLGAVWKAIVSPFENFKREYSRYEGLKGGAYLVGAGIWCGLKSILGATKALLIDPVITAGKGYVKQYQEITDQMKVKSLKDLKPKPSYWERFKRWATLTDDNPEKENMPSEVMSRILIREQVKLPEARKAKDVCPKAEARLSAYIQTIPDEKTQKKETLKKLMGALTIPDQNRPQLLLDLRNNNTEKSIAQMSDQYHRPLAGKAIDRMRVQKGENTAIDIANSGFGSSEALSILLLGLEEAMDTCTAEQMKEILTRREKVICFRSQSTDPKIRQELNQQNGNNLQEPTLEHVKLSRNLGTVDSQQVYALQYANFCVQHYEASKINDKNLLDFEKHLAKINDFIFDPMVNYGVEHETETRQCLECAQHFLLRQKAEYLLSKQSEDANHQENGNKNPLINGNHVESPRGLILQKISAFDIDAADAINDAVGTYQISLQEIKALIIIDNALLKKIMNSLGDENASREEVLKKLNQLHHNIYSKSTLDAMGAENRFEIFKILQDNKCDDCELAEYIIEEHKADLLENFLFALQKNPETEIPQRLMQDLGVLLNKKINKLLDEPLDTKSTETLLCLFGAITNEAGELHPKWNGFVKPLNDHMMSSLNQDFKNAFVQAFLQEPNSMFVQGMMGRLSRDVLIKLLADEIDVNISIVDNINYYKGNAAQKNLIIEGVRKCLNEYIHEQNNPLNVDIKSIGKLLKKFAIIQVALPPLDYQFVLNQTGKQFFAEIDELIAVHDLESVYRNQNDSISKSEDFLDRFYIYRLYSQIQSMLDNFIPCEAHHEHDVHALYRKIQRFSKLSDMPVKSIIGHHAKKLYLSSVYHRIPEAEFPIRRIFSNVDDQAAAFEQLSPLQKTDAYQRPLDEDKDSLLASLVKDINNLGSALVAPTKDEVKQLYWSVLDFAHPIYKDDLLQKLFVYNLCNKLRDSDIMSSLSNDKIIHASKKLSNQQKMQVISSFIQESTFDERQVVRAILDQSIDQMRDISISDEMSGNYSSCLALLNLAKENLLIDVNGIEDLSKQLLFIAIKEGLHTNDANDIRNTLSEDVTRKYLIAEITSDEQEVGFLKNNAQLNESDIVSIRRAIRGILAENDPQLNERVFNKICQETPPNSGQFDFKPNWQSLYDPNVINAEELNPIKDFIQRVGMDIKGRKAVQRLEHESLVGLAKQQAQIDIAQKSVSLQVDLQESDLQNLDSRQSASRRLSSGSGN